MKPNSLTLLTHFQHANTLSNIHNAHYKYAGQHMGMHLEMKERRGRKHRGEGEAATRASYTYVRSIEYLEYTYVRTTSISLRG